MPGQDGGDSFLVTAAVLEHMLGSGIAVRAARDRPRRREQDEDLGEAGDEMDGRTGLRFRRPLSRAHPTPRRDLP